MIDSFRGEYNFLSNMYLCPVPYENLLYPSSENAYQAQKFSSYQRYQFTQCTPSESKRLGRSIPMDPAHLYN